jgi:hypothetical protein
MPSVMSFSSVRLFQIEQNLTILARCMIQDLGNAKVKKQ